MMGWGFVNCDLGFVNWLIRKWKKHFFAPALKGGNAFALRFESPL